MKKISILLLIIIIAAVAYLGLQYGKGLITFFTLEKVEIAPNITAFLGYGGNSLVLVSPDQSEILIVDSKMLKGAKILRQFVDQLNKGAKVTLINTHFHSDHAGGNKLFPEAKIITGAYSQEQWDTQSGIDKRVDIEVRPDEPLVFTVGFDTIQVRAFRGHTWNDLIVYISNRSLLHTGDLVFNHWHPALLPNDGFDYYAWTASLDTLINEYDADIVIPGHGDMGDARMLTEMKGYFTSLYQATDNAEIESLKQRYAKYLCLPGMGINRNQKLISESRSRF